MFILKGIKTGSHNVFIPGFMHFMSKILHKLWTFRWNFNVCTDANIMQYIYTVYTRIIYEVQNVSVAQGKMDKRIYKHFDFMELLIT